MKVHIRGKNSVNLTQHDFIAKGGEGDVYSKGNFVYKIYHDINKMIPEAKIKELRNLDHDFILNPQDILVDAHNQLVGFTMKYIKDTEAVCKLFTNDFRIRNGIVPDQITKLVENIKETIKFIHSRKCLIVDGNEFNYLVDKTYTNPYFIDVDSYQTPNFPATAIMPSIRDYNTNGFTPLTDWFSFAIITCQLFVGIHPFKGKHKTIKGIENRVKNNVSIFNKNVSVPSVTRDFSLIPTRYFDWFINLFEKGNRSLPPDLAGVISTISPLAKIVISSAQFDINMIYEIKDTIQYFQIIHGRRILKTNDHIYIGNTKYQISNNEVVLTPKKSIPIFISIEDDFLKFKTLDTINSIISQKITAKEFMIIDNTLYAKNGGDLIELYFEDSTNIIKPLIKSVWQIMPKSSEMYSNIICQSVLGKLYVVIPIPKQSGLSSCINKHIPELDEFKIINAKYQSNIAEFIGFKDNKYWRITLNFSKDYSTYTIKTKEDIQNNQINFSVLDNGIVASITDDGILELSFNDINKQDDKVIENDSIVLDMKLYHDGNQLIFVKSNKLYTIKMK